MAYRVPQDIENDLQKRFPEVHVPTIVEAIFQSILSKTIKDSSCTVREFGKFIAFVTHSERMSKQTVRFKFKLSSALNQKMKSDQYLLENLPVKAKNMFTEENEKACESRQGQRLANSEAISMTHRHSKKKTDEALVVETIQGIIKKG